LVHTVAVAYTPPLISMGWYKLPHAQSRRGCLILASIALVRGAYFLTAPFQVRSIDAFPYQSSPVIRENICTGDQYREGKWVKSQTTVDFDLCTHHLDWNCAAIDNFNQLNGSMRVGLSLQWKWVPQHCTLHKFSPESMRELLQTKGRKIRYVGDSLNQGMAESMQCLLGKEYEHHVSHVRFDYLGCPDNLPTYTPDYCSNSSHVIHQWRKIVNNLQPRDILVVNTGAHWFGDPDEKKLAFRNIANAIATVFNGTVIMRTTVMGHDSCERFNEPTSNFNSSIQQKQTPSYNWANFTHLNRLVHNTFLEAGLATYLPLYVDMFEQRPDGHVQNSSKNEGMDCLHYCVPGPIHIWNELLYHLLYTILTDEDSV
jgi:hypothetical protein